MLSGWLPEAVVSHGFLGRERLPEMDAASRLVKILIILAQKFARVIAGRVDYDKAVVVAVLANIFESGDYIEFPFFQRAIDIFFEEDGIFGHGDAGQMK